jgi:hypothetical protein
MLAVLLVGALVGGGLYAAGHGLLGALAQKDVLAFEADVKAELDKFEATASADEKAVVAKVKALLAKL